MQPLVMRPTLTRACSGIRSQRLPQLRNRAFYRTCRGPDIGVYMAGGNRTMSVRVHRRIRVNYRAVSGVDARLQPLWNPREGAVCDGATKLSHLEHAADTLGSRQGQVEFQLTEKPLQ